MEMVNHAMTGSVQSVPGTFTSDSDSTKLPSTMYPQNTAVGGRFIALPTLSQPYIVKLQNTYSTCREYVLIFDGNMKNMRDVCAAGEAGFIEYDGTVLSNHPELM